MMVDFRKENENKFSVVYESRKAIFFSSWLYRRSQIGLLSRPEYMSDKNH